MLEQAVRILERDGAAIRLRGARESLGQGVVGGLGRERKDGHEAAAVMTDGLPLPGMPRSGMSSLYGTARRWCSALERGKSPMAPKTASTPPSLRSSAPPPPFLGG